MTAAWHGPDSDLGSEARVAERLPDRVSIGVLASVFPAALVDEVIEQAGSKGAAVPGAAGPADGVLRHRAGLVRPAGL